MSEPCTSSVFRRQGKPIKSPRRGPTKALRKERLKQRVPNTLQKDSSLQVLIEGASIYILCLVIPNIFSEIKGWFQTEWTTLGFLYQLALKTCSVSWFSKFQWCQQHSHQPFDSSTSVIAPDAELSDVAVVVILSLVMAIIRLSLVHFLVPDYKNPKRLRALVRCKSIHLLSSSYPGTVLPKENVVQTDSIHMDQHLEVADDTFGRSPIEGMDGSRTTKVLLQGEQLVGHNILGSLPKQDIPENEVQEDIDFDDTFFLGMDDETMEALDQDQTSSAFHPPPLDLSSAPLVSAGLITSSSALSLQNLLYQAASIPPDNSHVPSNQREDEERIFDAPKYATACFRMLFCSFSCTIALIYFQSANFWPPALGGNGSTKNCWDLSSVGAAIMDADFDHNNAVLRRYYIFQLSYHFHSGAFHILATLLLWFVSSSSQHQVTDNIHINNNNNNNKIFGIIPAGAWTIHNLQSLFQHSFAVGMLTFTYLFSSLRRLGVIAMFAFDCSSWFLHVLQMCINAPIGTPVRISAFWVRILHRFLVIPAFCYCRFYIFPLVIGYSALEESQDWLRQLENMLVPGTAKYIHGSFVISFCLLLLLNLVYVRRLLYHSHVDEMLHRPK